MFKLSEDELQRAFEGLNHHGFSTLFPEPLEWKDVQDHWDEIRHGLAQEDLDTYSPSKPLRIFAPKNRFNLRVVTHLHPQDLIIYTALVFIIRNDIEKSRIPKGKKRVFSFRANTRVSSELYQSRGAYQTYKQDLIDRGTKPSIKFVAVADIADFYPRVYQHRLENIIKTVATTSRAEEVGRILAKLLSKLSDGNSYGIPVGPYASRVLAEAVLIDVDDALSVNGMNFNRWVDDFAFFCRSDAEAQHALFFLAKWLYDKHGLTLHGAKTKIVAADKFVEEHVNTHEHRLDQKARILKDLWSRASPYDDDNEELTDEELAELEKINFHGLLADALKNKDVVDYEMVAFLLGRISNLENFDDRWRLQLVDTVLENVSHLYPISDSIARFFLSFIKVSSKDRNRIARVLLKPILQPGKTPPPEYYAMWVLSIFASNSAWNNAHKLLKIFQSADEEVTRRYAALALSQTGNRTHALSLRDDFEHASPLVRLAILRATRLLGRDERGHWKRMSVVSGLLEKRI